MKIHSVRGREIFDSRGIPTLACDLVFEDGSYVTSSVPTGLSRSAHEAMELRDGGSRLMGMGTQRAIQIIETKIAPFLIGKEPDLLAFDQELIALDNTPSKSRLGANTLLAVSMAICRAHAMNLGASPFELIAKLSNLDTVYLPCPMFNMINGGMHTQNRLQVQEFLIVPVGASSFREALELGSLISYTLDQLLRKKGIFLGKGDEGGYTALFEDEIHALDTLMEAIYVADHSRVKSILIGIDCAASQWYDPNLQLYVWRGSRVPRDELIVWYKQLIEQYPFYSIEDAFAEDDWQGWSLLMQAVGDDVRIVADDLSASQIDRINAVSEKDCAHDIIIKPNQIGTVTEAIQAALLCRERGRGVIASHRSGETNDSFIADFAIGVGASCIKAGNIAQGERLAKYHRLLAIENALIGGMELLDN